MLIRRCGAADEIDKPTMPYMGGPHAAMQKVRPVIDIPYEAMSQMSHAEPTLCGALLFLHEMSFLSTMTIKYGLDV